MHNIGALDVLWFSTRFPALRERVAGVVIPYVTILRAAGKFSVCLAVGEVDGGKGEDGDGDVLMWMLALMMRKMPEKGFVREVGCDQIASIEKEHPCLLGLLFRPSSWQGYEASICRLRARCPTQSEKHFAG